MVIFRFIMLIVLIDDLRSSLAMRLLMMNLEHPKIGEK